MHILLADDQPRVRSAMRLLLEQQPEAHLVEEVTDAKELLGDVRNCCPDILLLDWELPGLAPDKLVAAIRTLCPVLFIIVLDSMPHIGKTALKAGANEFVGKNDPPERLLAAINSCKDTCKSELRRN